MYNVAQFEGTPDLIESLIPELDALVPAGVRRPKRNSPETRCLIPLCSLIDWRRHHDIMLDCVERTQKLWAGEKYKDVRRYFDVLVKPEDLQGVETRDLCVSPELMSACSATGFEVWITITGDVEWKAD